MARLLNFVFRMFFFTHALYFGSIIGNNLMTSQDEKIVFYSDRSGNTEIYLMNPDGTDQQNITINPASDICPAIAPDGGKILFLSDRDGEQDIYIINSEGADVKRLTSAEAPVEHPSWSPDGTQILFIIDYATKTEIWIMNSDGTNQIRLTNNNARDERPVLSPDSKTVLFMSNRDGNYEIYMMQADGSEQTRITNTPRHEIFPVWSPDGNKIAYGQNYFGSGSPQADIHICNTDGSGDVVLTSASGRDENPCWSPDGSMIIFQSERDSNFELYKMNSDGTNQQRLTNSAGWDGWADWGKGSITSSGYLNEVPLKNHLYQNFPNPFNPNTMIRFSVADSKSPCAFSLRNVSLKIYDSLGRMVSTLMNELKGPGEYEVLFDGSGLTSGIYLCSLELNGIPAGTRKLCLLK